MKRLLREPLIHFLVLGAGIFALFGAVGDARDDKPDRLVVSAGKIENLVELWSRTWQRPPTPQELEGLIEDHIKEEVFYREARALGLDQDDTIIRRRLRQKMEFLVEDVAAAAEPTEAELQAFLAANPEIFRVGATMSFTHIYLNRDKRGDAARRDAERLRIRLVGSTGRIDPAALGDPFLLPHDFEALPENEVVKLFGREFAARLLELKPGQWTGPVESGYGVHLVFIRERTEPQTPELAEVRDAVSREWREARRREANAAFYQRLREKYTVTIDRSERFADISNRKSQIANNTD
ncbi:MAG: peptidyl-prolyl cis-trans isomerase [Acidiferrobacterales bacterium]